MDKLQPRARQWSIGTGHTVYLTTVELCGSLYGFLTKAQTYVSALQRCLYYVGTGADVGMV